MSFRRGVKRALVWLLVGLGVGAWTGVIDGIWAIRVGVGEGGGPIDRIGTVALAVAVDALLAAVAISPLALLAGLRHRTGPAPQHVARLPRRRLLALLAAPATGLLLALPASEPAGHGDGDRLNVVLISVDTLRASDLSSYGYGRETSPHLSQLARDGVLFESAYSSATWTLPAHASLFTGLDPLVHGVLASDSVLAPRFETLAEIYANAGYRTRAWVGTSTIGFMSARHGFDQGFERYLHFPHPLRFRSSALLRWLDDGGYDGVEPSVGHARRELDDVVRWLRGGERQPFFVFIHTYDVHSKFRRLPYEAPAPFFDRFCPGQLQDFDGCDGDLCASQRLLRMSNGTARRFSPKELARVRCLYDGGIAAVDQELGRFFDALRDLGLMERTIVVVTADHGEAFFEHGKALHATLHREITRIPLIFHFPGAARGKRVRGIVRIVDVMPTLLELTGLPVPAQIQGRSLARALTSWRPQQSREAFAVSRERDRYALRFGRYEYIERRDPRHPDALLSSELYDVAADPREELNLARYEPESVARAREELSDRLEADRTLAAEGAGPAAPRIEQSDAEREHLRALGYVSADERGKSAPAPHEDGGSRP